jgi:hypothetical protein
LDFLLFRLLGGTGLILEDNIKMGLKEIGLGSVDCFDLA